MDAPVEHIANCACQRVVIPHTTPMPDSHNGALFLGSRSIDGTENAARTQSPASRLVEEVHTYAAEVGSTALPR